MATPKIDSNYGTSVRTRLEQNRNTWMTVCVCVCVCVCVSVMDGEREEEGEDEKGIFYEWPMGWFREGFMVE